jgi:hypothetical protein
MRVLLDENVAHKLRLAIKNHETFTVQFMGFSGLKNGELLRQAETSGFDVLITGDKTLEYEQDMRNRKIAVVSLSAPHWPLLQPHLIKILLAIERAFPGSFTRVECCSFSRKHRRGGSAPG